MEENVISEISRNKSREKVFQIVYSFLILESCNIPIDFKGLIELTLEEEYDNVNYFIKKSLLNCLKYQKEIIDYIEPFLQKWTFKRLNYCIQAILISAVSDYKYSDEKIDKSVIINTAVKLAKKYGDDQKDYRYVNAILDNALNQKC